MTQLFPYDHYRMQYSLMVDEAKRSSFNAMTGYLRTRTINTDLFRVICSFSWDIIREYTEPRLYHLSLPIFVYTTHSDLVGGLAVLFGGFRLSSSFTCLQLALPLKECRPDGNPFPPIGISSIHMLNLLTCKSESVVKLDILCMLKLLCEVVNGNVKIEPSAADVTS